MLKHKKPVSLFNVSIHLSTLLVLLVFLSGCSELKSTVESALNFNSSDNLEEELPAKSLAIKGMDELLWQN